jgi:SagB-type dehydrogenase family enzyme
VSPAAASACLQLLANAGALDRTGPDDGLGEDEDPIRRMWSAHDLMFHARSRFGRHGGPFGATFRHRLDVAPLPAVKPPPRGPQVELFRPDMERLRLTDPPLAGVMESRRSVYDHGREPVSLRQLGEFLYRVARVRETGEMAVPGGGAMAVSSRPYPSGGKSYELEFYLTVAACDGLAEGLYHYDPLLHALTRVAGKTPQVSALLDYCAIAAPGCRPQILVTLAARFQRVTWKYDAIAYATILKHVGILYQSMYLVATAMGLAPSALGSGDSDVFAAAAGTDYLVETSVGEFILGSLPDAMAGDG